jgi:pyroglutamyl-peptidase
MTILVTGFQPFDNRSVNASWIAANSLASTKNVIALELPVVWGTPWTELSSAIKQHKPEIVISMGEGRQGWFDIETVARNGRSERQDNLGQLPTGPIKAAGPATIDATISAQPLQQSLLDLGYPIRISEDAGAYLCEETLYSLELLKLNFDCLKTVVFVHLPPFETILTANSESGICDTEFLQKFASALLDNVRKMPF